MPFFPERPPWDIEWCPKCRAWFGYKGGGARVSCCVMHAPGDCCHYGQTRLDVTPAKVEEKAAV